MLATLDDAAAANVVADAILDAATVANLAVAPAADVAAADAADADADAAFDATDATSRTSWLLPIRPVAFWAAKVRAV